MPKFRFRLAAGVLAALVAVGMLSGLSPAPAEAAVVTSCSNGGCPDPTGWAKERWKPHSDYPSNGGVVNGANCTNYVAWRLMRTQGFAASQLTGLGNARTWAARAAVKGYKVDQYPSVGAVAHWDNNHVAYVEKVNGDGTIVISESNVWVGNPNVRMWLRHRVVQASAVDNFIHFRPANPEGARTVIAPGDFDSDGFDDLIGVAGDGRVLLYRGNGSGGFLNPGGTKIASGWNTVGSVFAAGDMSGDGKPDVMVILKDGRVFLFRGTGAGKLSSAKTQVATGWKNLEAAFSPGDFSGDGFSDVIVLRPDGGLALFTGTGKGTLSAKSTIIGTGFGAVILVGSVGDFDGDAKADVIAAWPDGTVRLYRGDGAGKLLDAVGGTTGTEIAFGWNDVNTFAGRGDLDGDDRTDLFALTPDSSLFLYRGDGATLDTDGVPLPVTW